MINVELTFISGRCDFFSAWKYLTRLVVITPVGGVNFSIRGKEKASRLIKLVFAEPRSVTLQPTSIPFRIFHAWTFWFERLAIHLRCVRSSIARKKASARFLLNEIARNRNDTMICDISLNLKLFCLGKRVSWCRDWLYWLCSCGIESVGNVIDINYRICRPQSRRMRRNFLRRRFRETQPKNRVPIRRFFRFIRRTLLCSKRL